jgi:hypothetical protein
MTVVTPPPPPNYQTRAKGLGVSPVGSFAKGSTRNWHTLNLTTTSSICSSWCGRTTNVCCILASPLSDRPVTASQRLSLLSEAPLSYQPVIPWQGNYI